jgi:hypothetical protein
MHLGAPPAHERLTLCILRRPRPSRLVLGLQRAHRCIRARAPYGNLGDDARGLECLVMPDDLLGYRFEFAIAETSTSMISAYGGRRRAGCAARGCTFLPGGCQVPFPTEDMENHGELKMIRVRRLR